MINRIKLTSLCQDCNHINKHELAGDIIEENGIKYQVMFNGIKILYGTYHSPWMNEIIRNLSGHHEPQEELCFYHILKTMANNAKMLELGSNWAYYSIWFNKFINNPTNICIEPIKSNMDGGARNSEFNQCKIKFLHGCVGQKSSKNHKFVNWDGRISNITQYTVDELISDHAHFDIIHSDIQGAELGMLFGSMNSIDKIGYFIISTHDDKHNKCIDFLKNNNFTIIEQHSIKESFSCDGLIVSVNNKHYERYSDNVQCDLQEYFKNNCKISRRA